MEANPHHARGDGGRGILLGGQLVTMVGGPRLTRRRPGTHLEEAMRVGSWPPPPPAPALRIPPPPPPAAVDTAALAMMLRPVRLRQEEWKKEMCSICHSFLRYTRPNGMATRLLPCGHPFRGGRLTSLDASFMRCFGFFQTSSKTSRSMFFSKHR